jgi:anti-sigma factor RsiW
MSCTWQEKLDAYVDAELPAAEAAELEEHLHSCPACAADALQRMQLKRIAHVAGARYAPSPEFRLKIRQMVAEPAPRRRHWSWRWMPQLATAALVLLVLAGGGIWSGRAQRERTLAELTDLQVATMASEHPVDVISQDPHTVKPWFEGKLPFTFNLFEWEKTPFKLLGGKVAYLQGNPGAQLLFQVRKHQLGVFIFPDRVKAGGLMSGESIHAAFNVQTWAKGGLRYFVISDASPEDVRQLSDLLRQAQGS